MKTNPLITKYALLKRTVLVAQHLLPLSEIIYISNIKNNVIFHTVNFGKLSKRQTLKATAAEMDANLFVRINRACIVNLYFIESFTFKIVKLNLNQQLPNAHIARTRFRYFEETIEAFAKLPER